MKSFDVVHGLGLPKRAVALALAGSGESRLDNLTHSWGVNARWAASKPAAMVARKLG